MADKFKVVGLGKMAGGPMDLEKKELEKVSAEVEIVDTRCRSEEV